jgi:hypothetical protein
MSGMMSIINDPSHAAEGDESLGDGVFGYMIYDIPKGVGGYQSLYRKTPTAATTLMRLLLWTVRRLQNGSTIQILRIPSKFGKTSSNTHLYPAITDSACLGR